MKSIAVLLADDHTVVRQGLRALLGAEQDIEVVGEAENGAQAVKLARETNPEVIVMDLAMPLLNGVEATRQIHRDRPASRVLVLTSYGGEEQVEQMIAAGAAGYLMKHTAAQDLVRAIHEVHKGNAFFSPAIARRLCKQAPSAAQPGRTRGRGRELTPRESQVLLLIAQGFSNKQMAAELGISAKTIEKHRQHAMKKLGIHDIAGLTRYAVEKGLLEPSGSELEPAPPAPPGTPDGPENEAHSEAA